MAAKTGLVFEDVTPQTQAAYTRWLGGLSKRQLIEYADVKMMPRGLMLESWRRARQKKGGP
jgi:hypothetical protein